MESQALHKLGKGQQFEETGRGLLAIFEWLGREEATVEVFHVGSCTWAVRFKQGRGGERAYLEEEYSRSYLQ